MLLKQDQCIYIDNSNNQASIDNVLGSGGFGTVYRAIGSDGRIFAVKTLNSGILSHEEFDMLKNEATAAQRVSHRNVNQVLYFHDGCSHPGLPAYIVSQFANQGTLADFLNQRRAQKDFFEPEVLISLFLQIAEGMKAVNAEVIHRDFKPDNVLIHDGELKISDFGQSKIVGAATRTQTAKGVQHIKYMAPEAWNYDTNTIQLDMYSVGITFYELSTLQHPFNVGAIGDVHARWRDAHLYTQVLPIERINPGLSGDMSELILKLCKKRPTDRYSSWDVVIERIKGLSEANGSLSAAKSSLDLRPLLAKVRQLDHDAESRRIEAEKVKQEELQRQHLLKFCASEVRQIFQSIIDEFNKATDLLKLSLVERDNGFEVRGKQGKCLVSFHPAGMVQYRDMNVFTRDGLGALRERKLMMDGATVIAWARAVINSRCGFNLVLAQKENDPYGDWYIVENNHSVLSMNPQEKLSFALDNWDSLSRRIQRHRTTTDIIQSKVSELKDEFLLPYINELL